MGNIIECEYYSKEGITLNKQFIFISRITKNEFVIYPHTYRSFHNGYFIYECTVYLPI